MEEPEPTDPAQLLRKVVENGVRMGQPLSIAALETLDPVSLRPQAVTRALENLIGNAVRFGSRAEVSLVSSGRFLRFVVEDDGPGIPKERRAEAMEPFRRLDVARDPNKGGGVGLGLSIAADIARSHGGELRLSDSERLGGLRADLTIAR
jgi:two-component system osmolarity sensor histidine kinase EnvZ